MWGGFFSAYRAAKVSGAPSALDPQIVLLHAYPRAGSVGALDAISREAERVSRMKHWFGANPGEKYGVALLALEKEDIRRRSQKYAEFLARTKSESEAFQEITRAFKTILEDPRFVKYLDGEIGWLSGSSWFKWSVRMLRPAMVSSALSVGRSVGVFAEFGGRQGCRNLYAQLSAM